ncbi:MAG: Type prenyl endopeptidase Rce1-like [Pseudomonadota bacterium]
MTPLAPVQAIKATVISVVLAITLGEIYQFTSTLITPAWLAAATVNSVLALATLIYLKARATGLLRSGPRIVYAPALAVLVGSTLLAKLTAQDTLVDVDREKLWYFAASILWIPVIEELVFRGSVSQLLKQKVPPFWASWFSALIFTLVHGTPTLERILSGQLGFALGAFLLGICCEALVYFSGSLLPAVALHAACNATVMIFGVINPRWLDWLGPLYLK